MGTVSKLVVQLGHIVDRMNSPGCSRSERDIISQLLVEVSPVLTTAITALKQLFGGMTAISQAMSRLAYICARAAATVFTHGFGRTSTSMDDDGEGNDDGEGDDKELDGTGMGEGKGDKD